MDVDVLIIGGGVIGLACAAESSSHHYGTLLVERHESFGQETSSRNSEVVHSGIYYTPGSLKAQLCLAGNRTTYAECERLGVWHNRCGKLIVAVVPEEKPELENIYTRGLANGLEGLKLLEEREARKIEPNIRCHSAIYVPSTGVVDSHELMKAYMQEAKSAGGDFAFGVEYVGAKTKGSAYEISLKDTTGESIQVTARIVVNAAGLFADAVAASFGIETGSAGYRIYPNRGHYYRVSSARSRLVSRLVYPIPNRHLTGLGIHITLDRAGQLRLGPDAEYLDRSTPVSDWYKFEDNRSEKFFQAAARYFPALEPTDLTPDQVGVRPKIQGPGDPVKDFIVKEESDRGLPGLINLIGIESPGLTCAREIARKTLGYIAAGIGR
jgi:L-2-hydroxyglutarate oxidase LhgO